MTTGPVPPPRRPPAAGGPPEPAVLRRLLFLLRAYPVPWREQRGAELLGTVLDLLGPGADRVGWRLSVDLVRGGWATRLREHPPVLRWLGYRCRARLPLRWRARARQDILGRFYPLRLFLANSVLLVPSIGVWLWYHLRYEDAPWWLALVVPTTWLTAPALMFFMPDRWGRRQALLRQGMDEAGRPVMQSPGYRVLPRPVWQVWPWLVGVGAAGVLLAVPWQAVLVDVAPTLAAQPDAPASFPQVVRTTTAVCLLAGGTLAAVALRRLPRRLDTRTPAYRGRVFAADRLVVAMAVLSYATTSESLAFLRFVERTYEPFSLGLHCLVLLTAPTCLVAGLVARRAERRGGLVVTGGDVIRGAFGFAPRLPDHPPELVTVAPGYHPPAHPPAHRPAAYPRRPW